MLCLLARVGYKRIILLHFLAAVGAPADLKAI